MVRRKRTRDELISNGFCPSCSKSTKQVDGFERYTLYACERCGFFAIESNHNGSFNEISLETWQQFQGLYWARLSRAEAEVRGDLPRLFKMVVAGKVDDPKVSGAAERSNTQN